MLPENRPKFEVLKVTAIAPSTPVVDSAQTVYLDNTIRKNAGLSIETTMQSTKVISGPTGGNTSSELGDSSLGKI